MLKEKLLSVKVITIGVLVILIVILVLQNTQVTEVRFFFWTVAMSRVILFLILFAIGVLVGGGAAYSIFTRAKRP